MSHFGSRFMAGGAPGYGEAAPGDHLQTSYHLWLFGHQIENGRFPWRDPYSFRPEAKPTVNPAVWPYGPIYWPLWRIFGQVLAWNLFVLLTFLGAGLLAFAWLLELGVPRGPALVGGLAFEIAPYRAVQSAGHLLGPVSLLLPLSLWTLERGRRGNPLWLLVSAGSIASIPLSGQVHLAIGAIPLYAAYAVVRLPAVERRRVIYLAGAALGVALSVAAGILIDRVVVQGSVSAGGRPLSAVGAYSADWLDFLVRHKRHGSESFVFLGWATPLLAILGVVVLARIGKRWLAAVLGLAAVVPMLLALGTNTPLYRPVRAVVPGLQYPRVPERLMPVACLAIAALVAFAVTAIADVDLTGSARQAWSGLGRLATGGAGLVVVPLVAIVGIGADLHVTALHATVADQGNKAYAALASAPKGARVLELPVFLPDIHYGSVYQYYDIQAKRERPNGYSTTAPVVADVVARRLLPIDCGDWTASPGGFIQRLGVREIAFHTGLFVLNPEVPTRTWFAWRALVQHGYRPWVRDGAVTILDRRRGGPPPAAPVKEPDRSVAQFCRGWFVNDGNGRAMSAGHTGLWAYGTGVRLIMRSLAPVDVTFSIDGKRAFTRPLTEHVVLVNLQFPRRDWHLVTLDTPTLPAVAGRQEGARLLAYALG